LGLGIGLGGGGGVICRGGWGVGWLATVAREQGEKESGQHWISYEEEVVERGKEMFTIILLPIRKRPLELIAKINA
jgi:hypothetical protein